MKATPEKGETLQKYMTKMLNHASKIADFDRSIATDTMKIKENWTKAIAEAKDPNIINTRCDIAGVQVPNDPDGTKTSRVT